MNIDEAIKVLKAKVTDFKSDLEPTERAAILLGLQALGRIKECRAYKEFPCTTDLPAETED